MKNPIRFESRSLLAGLLLSLCSLPLLRAAELFVPDPYPTIQAAVDASVSGDTIRIAAGDYYQQIVVVDKANLTIAGEPGAVIHAWNGMTQTLAPHNSTAIVSLGLVRSDVVIAGLTFHGESLGDSYTSLFLGILFRGSSGTVTNCTVRNFRGFGSAVPRGINVVNLVSFGTPVLDVSVLNSTFADNARSINLTGDDGNANATLLRTRFTIEGNTFTGFGPTSTLPNYGVVIFTGAGGEVKGNTMTGYSYAGAATSFSSAIHAFDNGTANRPVYGVPVRPVRYEGNIFSTNDHHLVMVSANDSTVVSNLFQATSPGVRRWGCLVFSGTNVVVAQNDFSDTPIGVELFGGDLSAGVLRGVATDPKLHTNRFCRVYTPIHAQPLANGIQEQGTEVCTNPPASRLIQVPAEYATIQEAVNAADPEDTIHIAAGDYYEQVTIANKGRLNLVGEPGTVIHATLNMSESLRPYNWLWYPLVAIYRTEVVVSGITLEGHQLGDQRQTLIGLYFLGSSGRVTNCTVRGFRGTSTDARGINVNNPVSLGTPPITVRVSNNTFTDNARSINLSGDTASNNVTLLRTSFAVEGNTFTGFGVAPEGNFGIVIFTGAGGEVKGNTMTGYSYAGAAAGFSSAILAHDGSFNQRGYLPLRPISCEGNIFSTNDHHLIMISANDSSVVSNVFLGNGLGIRRWGSVALSGTNITVANNDFSGTPIGIELFGGDLNGSFLRGVATNPKLHTNRFCQVYTPIHAQPLANGIQEQGTELCTNSPVPRVIQVPAEYATIQEAVNAAEPGDTIHIAAGDYYEQVTIANKGRLNLVGEPGTVIHATDETNPMTETLLPYGTGSDWGWYRLVAIYRTEVVINGITLDGHQLGGVYQQSPDTGLIGLYFFGSSGQVTNCTVRGFRGPTLTTETVADGIQVFNPVQTGSSEVNVSVCASTFGDNERSLVVRGDPVANPAVRRVTAVIKENSISGLGLVPFWNVGVWFVCGVTGDVVGNNISDFAGSGNLQCPGIAAYDAAAYTQHGRFVPLQPINFEGNTLTNNGQHLLIIGGNDCRVVNNKFLGNVSGAGAWGALGLSGTNMLVANNNFSDLPTGMLLVGNESWSLPWPTIPPAANVRLTANWFCNVPEPIRVDTNLVVGLQEEGTAQCENGPLQPVFQSIRNSNGAGATLTLRAWHGESVVIESSANLETNLVNWVPIYTNAMSLPVFDFHDTNGVGAGQRFYRAVKP